MNRKTFGWKRPGLNLTLWSCALLDHRSNNAHRDYLWDLFQKNLELLIPCRKVSCDFMWITPVTQPFFFLLSEKVSYIFPHTTVPHDHHIGVLPPGFTWCYSIDTNRKSYSTVPSLRQLGGIRWRRLCDMRATNTKVGFSNKAQLSWWSESAFGDKVFVFLISITH